MSEPRRLFDCISQQLEKGGLSNMLVAKERGQWKEYSTAQVKESVDKLSAGLLSLGVSANDGSIEGRDKIAIMSKNRPEWMIVDMAVQQIGAVLVPVYPTIGVNDLEFIFKDAKVKYVFVNDEDMFLKILSIRNRVDSIKEVYTFEHTPNAKHWKELVSLGTDEFIQKVKPIADTIDYKDLVTLIYTSGTTGTPKGVMLSHENILSNVIACIPCLPRFPNMRALSFLPLNHIYERMLTYFYLFYGTSVYYAESLDTIGDNLKEVKPDIFSTVPRLLEKVYDRIMTKGGELTGIKRKLFFWAHDLANRYEINKNQGMWYNFQLAMANKIIFSKWREGLGNNIRVIVSGGAAAQVRLIRIFTAAKIHVLEGYGLTETSPVIAVNRFEVNKRKFGTVGPLLDGVQVKIAEDGEILCKGPNVMIGYYKRPDLTAEVLHDGWFSTGDIGTMVDGTYLKITDRKKELFKTSGGKYVAPLAIEGKLTESIYIEQIMIVGSEQKFVGALIVPSFSNLKEWCRQHGITYTTDEEMIRNPQVIDMFKELVETFNKYFNHVEQVKRFELLPCEWSVNTGELTPKLSLKRKVIMEKYKDSIERIYS
jgi:long-chain acyl-CoA synthetase